VGRYDRDRGALLAILALVTLVGIPFAVALVLAAIPVLLVARAQVGGARGDLRGAGFWTSRTGLTGETARLGAWRVARTPDQAAGPADDNAVRAAHCSRFFSTPVDIRSRT
jgi:hypothetical protein